MSQQRRVHERYDIRLAVTVTHRKTAGEATPYSGTTRNVSLGGMLIEGDAAAIPFGAEVGVRIDGGGADERVKLDSELAATVRWVQGGAIGVQFGSLRAKEQWALNQLLKDAPPSP